MYIKIGDASAEQLPQGKFDCATWDIWINNIKNHTTKRGQELFLPIRMALTGEKKGPEIKHLLPFMNQEQILKRFRIEQS